MAVRRRSRRARQRDGRRHDRNQRGRRARVALRIDAPSGGRHRGGARPTAACIRRLDGLEKDNTGYDLAGLLCGSEGTLAVVTAARLRLVSPARAHRGRAVARSTTSTPRSTRSASCAARSTASTRSSSSSTTASIWCATGSRPGTAVPAAITARTCSSRSAAQSDPTAALADAVGALRGCRRRRRRDRHGRGPASLALPRSASPKRSTSSGRPHKLDVTLPARALAAFVRDGRTRVQTRSCPDAAVWLFGHAGDGNVHVNVTGVAPDDDRVNDVVLGLVASLHGSISAEHGIGTAKRAYASARAQRDGDRHVPRDQARARPGRDPESARAASAAE